MKKIVLILLGVIFIGIAGYLIFTGKFSLKSELTQTTVSELLSLKECRLEGIPEEYGSCTMDISKQDGHWEVIVTYDRFFDDSVKAGRTEAIVEYRDGQWTVRNIVDTYQCWPGRGHQDFSTELCI